MDDIFYHIDAEAACLQTELLTHSASDKHTKADLEALLHLKQIPPVFRPSFAQLLSDLPITVEVGSREKLPAKREVDLQTNEYAHFRCVFEDEGEGGLCEAWTLIPFVTDTYFLGLAKILSVAANTTITIHKLEGELTDGLRSMFCNRHEEKQKDVLALTLALKSRPVIEEWRERELSRSYWGLRHRDCVPLHTAERLREDIASLREENHKLRREVNGLNASFRNAGGP